MYQAPGQHDLGMRKIYGDWFLEQYEFARSHPLILALIKTHVFWFFFLGPLLVFPVFALGIVLPPGFS